MLGVKGYGLSVSDFIYWKVQGIHDSFLSVVMNLPCLYISSNLGVQTWVIDNWGNIRV